MIKIFLILLFMIDLSFAAVEESKFGHRTWQPLKPGDAIYIIAPSHGFPSKEHRIAAYENARENLARFGLRAIWNEEAFSHKDPFCPETAMDRVTAFRDLRDALESEAKAIWAIRGGGLSLELWEFLEKNKFSFSHKPLLGFSDITSLHLYFNARGRPTIHAPVLYFGKDAREDVNKFTSLKDTMGLLMGKTPMVACKGLRPMNEEAREPFWSRAPLLGGNLSSLHDYDSVFGGSSLSDHFLMIEAIDDYTRIDSTLSALRQGTFFENTSAIIFGVLHEKSFEDPLFEAVQQRCELSIQKFAQQIGIPVFEITPTEDGSTFQFGHGDWNHAFPLGALAELVVSEEEGVTLKVSAS
jgi:muramoyltetrapeptide carboxypeptidase